MLKEVGGTRDDIAACGSKLSGDLERTKKNTQRATTTESLQSFHSKSLVSCAVRGLKIQSSFSENKAPRPAFV